MGEVGENIRDVLKVMTVLAVSAGIFFCLGLQMGAPGQMGVKLMTLGTVLTTLGIGWWLVGNGPVFV